LARSHGLVVKADGSWSRGREFKPRHRILDGCKQFASYYIKEKLKYKGSQIGHTKKTFKKPDLYHLIDKITTDTIMFKFSLMRTTFKSNYFFKWSLVEKHHQVNKKIAETGMWNHETTQEFFVALLALTLMF
jgi:hypothetical protein